MSHSIRTRKLAVVTLMALGAVFGTAAHADEEAERANLERIENEIAQIQAMVAAASRENIPTQRVNFRYDWLMADLEVMRKGIQQHINAPRQARPVEPLRGDYRN